jgi:hypothetical protein
MSMSAYYGPVSECKVCTASRNAADIPERTCYNCFGRGFVAQCMLCDGKGYTSQPVAGAQSGSMNATCNGCGGRGCYGVNKPEGWVVPEREEKKLETAKV